MEGLGGYFSVLLEEYDAWNLNNLTEVLSIYYLFGILGSRFLRWIFSASFAYAADLRHSSCQNQNDKYLILSNHIGTWPIGNNL